MANGSRSSQSARTSPGPASEPRSQARARTHRAELAATGGAGCLRLAMTADQQFLDALATLWRIPRPGPDNLLSAPAFVTLSELCDRRYGRGQATFALSSALRSLGLPCGLPLDQSGLALDVPTAAAALDAAYTRVMTVR